MMHARKGFGSGQSLTQYPKGRGCGAPNVTGDCFYVSVDNKDSECFKLSVSDNFSESCFAVICDDSRDTGGDTPYSGEFNLPEDIDYVFAAHVDSKNIIVYVVKGGEGWLYVIPYTGSPIQKDLTINPNEEAWTKTLMDSDIYSTLWITDYKVFDLLSVKNHGFSENMALGRGKVKDFTLISSIDYTAIQKFSISASYVDFMMMESDAAAYAQHTDAVPTNINFALPVTIPYKDEYNTCYPAIATDSKLDTWGNARFMTDHVTQIYDIASDQYSTSVYPAEFIADNHNPPEIDCSYDYITPALKWYYYSLRDNEHENLNHPGGSDQHLIGKFDIPDSDNFIAIYNYFILFNAYAADPKYRFFARKDGDREGWENGGVQHKCEAYVEVDTRSWQISPIYDGTYLYTNDMTRYLDGGSVTIYDIDGTVVNTLSACVLTARDGFIYYTENIDSTTIKIRGAGEIS